MVQSAALIKKLLWFNLLASVIFITSATSFSSSSSYYNRFLLAHKPNARNLGSKASGKVEIIGFLAPEGYVSIDTLLLTKQDDGEKGDCSSDQKETYSSEERMNYSSWLQASFASAECRGVQPDSIPCFEEKMNPLCHVPFPRGYQHPYTWPSSISKIRAQNIAANTVSKFRSQIENRRGTIYLQPSSTATVELSKLLQTLRITKSLRLVLDVESGLEGLNVELEKYGALTLSIAAPNSARNAIQIILERGFSGLLYTLNVKRLPFPNQAFDLVHCGECNVQWTANDGLMEVDRILRRGGFFIWQSKVSDEGQIFADTQKMIEKICWSLYFRKGRLAIWQKSLNNTCYRQHHSINNNNSSQNPATTLAPPVCDADGDDDGDAWLRPCITAEDEVGKKRVIEWPERLTDATKYLRSSKQVDTKEAYAADLNYWKMLTDFYLTSLGPERVSDIRNVLDMNAGYGGFAGALALRRPALHWWVLSVTPKGQHHHLPNLLERGLLGIYHDWCRALETYPRAFDMIHVSRFLSSKSYRCSMMKIVMEIDRLVRPGGFVIIRDEKEILIEVQQIVSSLHWKTTIEDTDSGPNGKDKLLHCQKTFWKPPPPPP